MMNFNFVEGDIFELDDFNSIEKFVDTFPDFQTVVLNDEQELKLLLQLMGIEDFNSHSLNKSEFSKYWNLSNFKVARIQRRTI